MTVYRPELPESREIFENVKRALSQDIGRGDATASLIDENKQLQTRVICRDFAVLCGVEWFNQSFSQLDPGVQIEWHFRDGDSITPDTEVCHISGRARSILSAERTALNFLQTLSATASLTRQYVELLASTSARLLDTRKTIPGLRKSQKYAVLCGGGHNHRQGLYDAILIKENHIEAAGSIMAAVNSASSMHPNLLLEVEVENIHQLREAVAAGAQRVLLDNFSIKDLTDAVLQFQDKIELEASGGVQLDTVKEIADTGVDFISTGDLTKNIRAVDFSMRFK